MGMIEVSFVKQSESVGFCFSFFFFLTKLDGYVKTERLERFLSDAGEGASCYLVSHSTKASLLDLMLVAKQRPHRA